jgi:phosphoribosylanthranilate isomerase
MSEPIIQIAGVIDLAEAQMLCAAGANYLGFPLRLKDGREDQSEDEARAIIAAVGANAKSIVITYLADADEIIKFCDDLSVDGVQLHDAILPSELARIRALRPELFIIKSLVIHGDNIGQLETLVDQLHPLVDAFITDTYDAATGRSGATGMTHDWQLSRRLVDVSPNPVILAGGLSADNVRQAILAVQPAGVDVHTGIEGSDGRKNAEIVQRFIAETRAAFAQLT